MIIIKKFSIFIGVRNKLDELLILMHSPIEKISKEDLNFLPECISNTKDDTVKCYVMDERIEDENYKRCWKTIAGSSNYLPVAYIYQKYWEIIKETENIRINNQRNRKKVDNL